MALFRDRGIRIERGRTMYVCMYVTIRDPRNAYA